MTTIDKIKAEIQKVLDAEPDTENAKAQALALFWVLELLDKYAEQEPISVSVSEKEPDEISEEVTLRFFRNSLKVRWQDMVIYNVEWLKKNWQMEMDIVCGVKPCDDVVSRQAVYEILDGNWNTDFLRAEVEKLPSVRPQEPNSDIRLNRVKNELNQVKNELKSKTGHWIIIDDCEQFIAKCSKCGRIEDSRMLSRYPYCHCGARMVGTQESEETNEEM